MHVNSNENTAENPDWQKNEKGTHRTDLYQFLLDGGKKMIFAVSKQKVG